MKKIIILLLLTQFTFAQTQNKKVKVILLGTFHFGATTDRNSTKFEDVFSEKRQNELDIVAKQLSKNAIEKIFIEDIVDNQAKRDLQFEDYKNNKIIDEKILKNEIVQVAFRTAKLSNAKLVCADFEQELPYDKIEAWEKKNKDLKYPYTFFEIEYPFKEKRKKLAESTLSEFYIQINNQYTRQAILFDYLHYALSYGTDKEYVGTDLATSYYDRNLKIFTTILRNIDLKTDNTIMILFGSSHTAILRQFFENHPYFEIVELETLLK
ncbi:DUF5694 domain-containing protein [Flavobacterium sp.]|uniref:DUF5694 domain-containing protein n=1 Tax=Flavobacterium sp. TaxID=239 RepID=UPI00286C6383|nr:DUF5694 domain-containing protein [Flavobacterium sp.]